MKQGNGGGMGPRKKYVHTRPDYLTMIQAGYKVQDDTVGILFYERGFFGVMWMDKGIRVVRDLKRW